MTQQNYPFQIDARRKCEAIRVTGCNLVFQRSFLPKVSTNQSKFPSIILVRSLITLLSHFGLLS